MLAVYIVSMSGLHFMAQGRPNFVTTRSGDVVVLVMRGMSLTYLAQVRQDGETLDTLKNRLTSSMRKQALADARAQAAETGGRVLRWTVGDDAPELWPD